MADLAILASYAHPDDEQGVTGTLARAAREGIRTGLLCATRGELGEIADPALATPDTLGAVREGELRAAAERAGIGRLWFLNYRDSGMVGTEGNADPAAFINADADEVVGRIVAVIREFRPQVIVTFDPTGGYGHPDHLAICRWTTAAFHAAGEEGRFPEAGRPWAPARLFYSSFPRSVVKRMLTLIDGRNPSSPFRDTDPEQMGLPDEAITHRVDVSDFVQLKAESLQAHKTQLNPNSPLARLPADFRTSLRSKEYFALVAGTPPPPDADRSDVFAGLG